MSKNLLVIGGGESGTGAAVLGQSRGWSVFVTDNNIIKDKYKEVFDSYSILWEEKTHSFSKFENVNLVVKSPGVPANISLIKYFTSRGIEVIDEIEFAYRYTDAKMICITGSNGKTTTTLLTYHLLKKAGLNVGLAGNIGKSLAFQVATENFDIYVIELSSFQLDGLSSFRADFAAIMNITPDHLDRYDYKLENYVLSKFRVINNMKGNDLFVYCKDNDLTCDFLSKMEVSPKTISFSLNDIEDSVFSAKYKDRDVDIDIRNLSLKGKHNIYNCIVASYVALYCGLENEIILEGLGDFSPVEHRLEYVATIDGIEYINDSKATNVDSCWYALDSMEKKVIWIVGGKDKGNDYSLLYDLVRKKVKALICLGVDNSKLMKLFSDKVDNIVETKSVDDAIKQSLVYAKSGDVILLSPCCASFDLFNSYEDRGDKFKVAVLKLK